MGEDGFSHILTLEDRNRLAVTGVSEVVSFDENGAVLHTCQGILLVRGQQLQLKNLSEEGGRVAVEGQVDALVYENGPRSGGWLRRLLG